MTLFRRQGGVASVAALRARGTTDNQIRWAVDRGLLARVRHGWLQTPDANAAVVEAVAAGGRLGCISAAEFHGVWVPETDGVHVSLPRHAGRHTSRHVIAHWEGSRWRDLRSPVEPVPSMIRQIIMCCDRETALCVIDSALHRRRLSLGHLRQVLSPLPLEYHSLAREVDGKAESGYESLCRFRLSRLGIPIRSQVRIPGVGFVDLLLGDRLIVEADGWEWHNGPDAFLVDRSRDLAAVRQDYLPLRLAPHHIQYEWPWVERVVKSIVERRDHVWSDTQLRRRSDRGFGG